MLSLNEGQLLDVRPKASFVKPLRNDYVPVCPPFQLPGHPTAKRVSWCKNNSIRKDFALILRTPPRTRNSMATPLCHSNLGSGIRRGIPDAETVGRAALRSPDVSIPLVKRVNYPECVPAVSLILF